MCLWQKMCTRSSAIACGPSWPPAWRSSSPGTRGQAHEDLGAEAEHFQVNCEEKRCQRTRDTNLMLWGEVSLCQSTPRQGTGLAQEELLQGVGEEGLASQQTWLQPFELFCGGRLWVIDEYKASQQKRWPDQEDEGSDGVPFQGHRGEGLLDVKVQNQGCCRR